MKILLVSAFALSLNAQMVQSVVNGGVPAASTSITKTQTEQACNATSGSTITCTFVSAITSSPAGFVIALVTSTQTSVLVSSIAGGGCTWALAHGGHLSKNAEVWYGENCTGGGANSNKNVVATMGATITSSSMTVSEWTGLPTSGTFDSAATCTTNNTCDNNATSATSTSPVITPTASKYEVCTSVSRNAGSASSLTSDGTGGGTWTSMAHTNGASSYQIITSTSGTYGNHWTVSSAAWEHAIACFKAN